MDDISSNLVGLYAKNASDQVNEQDFIDVFNPDSYEEVKELPEFVEKNFRIRKVKKKLERIGDKYEDIHEQALRALRLLKDARGSQRVRPIEFWETEALIRQYLYPSWGDHQQEYNRRCKVFTHWYDAFISYTNRDALDTNSTYPKLIIGVPRDIRLSKPNPKNCVAHVVAQIIRRNNLECFRDFEKLECGDDIEDIIREHARTSFVFIQLLEPEIFAQPTPPKRNWCYEEFKEFEKSTMANEQHLEKQKRFFGILLRGSSFDEVAPLVKEPYTKWINTAESKLSIITDAHKMTIDKFSLEVRKIVANLLNTKNNLIDAMLSDW
jgi:hypothetical protein